MTLNQSINQSKHISIAPYVASESEAHNTAANWVKNHISQSSFKFNIRAY